MRRVQLHAGKDGCVGESVIGAGSGIRDWDAMRCGNGRRHLGAQRGGNSPRVFTDIPLVYITTLLYI